ncbi:Mov34/MPN/PAD-1 family protein [Myxococcus sp. Y35]|uniref:Mov34/MPN/PAD-1 family protein n=1 Tax=Pseudomyxococcus flavus TaxID=3115648 RepID=UPI003CF22368
MRWPEHVRAEVARHLEATYPLEGCGVILQNEAHGYFRVRPLRNAAANPGRAYAFAPEEWLAVCMEADVHSERVVCVFHSHVDAPAIFSEEDLRQAAPAGHPLLPDVSYLIGSIHRGCVRCLSEYEWRDGDFKARSR